MSSLTGVAARLQKLPAAIIEEATRRFDEIAKESASRVVGGGATMRMHGRGGRRIPITMGTKANGSGESVFINGIPSAQWRWIEDGTKPHSVGRRGRFLSAPRYDHPVRGPISHPGTTGQRAWSRAIDEFRGEFRDIAVEKLKEAAGG